MTSLSSFVYCAITCLCLTFAVDAGKKPMYARECVVWENISRSMEQEPNVELKCKRNDECSGMDCIGKYNYDGSLSGMVSFEKDFCSGIVVEACSKPTQVQMYVVPFSKDHKPTPGTELTVTNSTEMPIKGQSLDILGNEGKIIMDIKMNHTTINKKPHIFLSAFMRVRVHAKIFGAEFEQYLDGFEVGVVRGVYIPVPECDPHVGNHTHESGMCTWKSISQLKRVGPQTPCDLNSMQACENHEMCDAQTKKCVCLPKYDYDSAKNICIPAIIIDYEDTNIDDTGQSSNASQKHIIIIVCSIAGLLVLAAVIAFILVKYKRHRDRYGQHRLVLAEDDDPEVNA